MPGATVDPSDRRPKSLERLAELSISAQHVQRLTERLGKERGAERDKAAAAMKGRKLRSAYKQAPAVAVVMVDAGKAQFRQEDKGPGVHGAHWGDIKMACLQTYPNAEYDQDPQPDPPEAFLDPARVQRLCREMQRVRGAAWINSRRIRSRRNGATAEEASEEEKASPPAAWAAGANSGGDDGGGGGVWMDGQRRGDAPQDVCGQEAGLDGRWRKLGRSAGPMHFPDWIQILDFLHLLVHLFAAARLAYAKDAAAAWKLYERMLRRCLGRKAQAVINALESQCGRMRAAAAGGEDACRVVELAMGYVERNRERMDYPRYRPAGPAGEQFAGGVAGQADQPSRKGTEQFWIDGGLEAVLQVGAAYLSQDDRAEEFHDRGPRGPAVGRNRVKAFQPAA